MKYNELEKILRKNGCYLLRNSKHPEWFSPITGKKFKTSHHKSEEVAKGTLRSISRDSGVKF